MASDSTTNEKKAAKQPPRNHLQVRTKTWIENAQQEMVFGKGKTEILELIERQGSIARAAAEMGLSYKKAWSHVKILQKQIEENLVISHKGGIGSGGSQLTPEATELMKKYRQLQKDVENFANHRFIELFLSDPP
jgi:molybdate transport repressor ModE-like protein